MNQQNPYQHSETGHTVEQQPTTALLSHATIRKLRLAQDTPESTEPSSKKRPLCAYSRLSEDRDGKKIGYEIQTAGIQAWADANGETIGHWYRDRDISAADLRKTRSDFEQMLLDVAAGKWGGIVVWRLDRLVRLTVELSRINIAINEHGGFIATTHESTALDTRTQMGQMFMWVMVLLAEFEIQTIKARVSANIKARRERGEYIGGGRRAFGFVGSERDSSGKLTNSGQINVQHKPDEVELIREAASRILHERWTWSDVARDWNSRQPPVQTASGGTWHPSTVKKILCAPRIVGRSEWIEFDHEGKPVVRSVQAQWEPIIDQATWERLNALHTHRSDVVTPRKDYLLSKLIVCAVCKEPLTGTRKKYDSRGNQVKPFRLYVTKYFEKPAKCTTMYIRADETEAYVTAQVLARIRAHAELTNLTKDNDTRINNTIKRLEAIVRECEDQLADLSQESASTGYTIAEYNNLSRPIRSRLTQAKREISTLSQQIRVPSPPVAANIDLATWFHGLTFDQKRQLLMIHVERIEVLPAKMLVGRVNPAHVKRTGGQFNPDRVRVIFRGTNKQ